MNRRFCDYCGDDITEIKYLEILIYDRQEERYLKEKDVCRKCYKKINKFIKTLKK